MAQPTSYADRPTKKLRDLLAGRQVIAEGLASTIAQLQEQLRKAEDEQRRVKHDEAHLESLIRWRENTQADAGDPIAAFADLIEQILAGPKAWRLLAVEVRRTPRDLSTPAEQLDDARCILLLRRPDGTRVRVTFTDGWASSRDVDAWPWTTGGTYRPNRSIESFWLDAPARWHILMPPTGNKGDMLIEVGGALLAVEELGHPASQD